MSKVDALCGRPLRDGPCNMDAEHRGRCSSVAWECDGCGKRRRGQPTAFGPEEVGGWYCFMCAPPSGTNREREVAREEYDRMMPSFEEELQARLDDERVGGLS